MRCRGALRGIEADFGPEHADTFRRDLRADYVLANPPFNTAAYGTNFARLSHPHSPFRLNALKRLAPQGMARLL